MKIKFKFMITVTVILCLGAALMVAWIYYSSYDNTLCQAIQDGTVLADAIHESVYTLMSTGQQEHLDAYMEKANKIKSVHEIRVMRSATLEKELGIDKDSLAIDDLDRQVLMSGHEINKEITVGHARAIRRVTPIFTNQSCLACHTSFKAGEVIAGLSTTLEFQSSFDRTVRNLVCTGLLQLTVILGVIAAIFALFNALIMRPLLAIGTFVKKVGKGDLSALIQIKKEGRSALLSVEGGSVLIDPKDEIGDLAVAFNEMSSDLQHTTVSLEALNQEVQERKKAEAVARQSEERFRTIFERSAVAIMMADGNETVVSWNKFAEELLGMGHDEMQLKPVNSFYPPEEWQKIRALDIRKTGILDHFETVMLRKDGSRVDVDISISVVKDSSGKITGSIGIARNISDRKRAEKEAAALALRNKILMQTGSDGIQVLDEQGNVVEVNDAFCQMLGYTREELLRMNVADWNVQWTAQELKTMIGQLMDNPGVFETRHRSKDGTIREVEVSARGVILEDRRYLYASARDITERKEREAIERKQKRELEVFYKASIGREARILELKKEVERLRVLKGMG